MALLEHNLKVYNESVDYFKNGGRDLLITQDTGTGKSYICVELLKTIFKGMKVLYVVPKWSIAENFKDTEGFNEVEENIEFATYNSFTNVDVVNEYLEKYDVFVFDEAHHLGSDKYGSFAKNLIDIVKEHENCRYVLGMTATPVREDKQDISDYFTKRIQGITLFECMNNGLMPYFDYIVASSEFIDKYNNIKSKGITKFKFNLDFVNSEDFIRDVLKTNNKDKWICFFSSLQELNDMKPVIRRLFPEYTLFEIHSKSEEDYVASNIEKKDKVVILSVDMFLEGIHFKGCGGILLFRNVGSITVFRQILGRVSSIGMKDSPIVIDCTKSAINMAVKLRRLSRGTNPKTSYYQEQYENIQEVINVKLDNKKYYDILDVILDLEVIEFNDKLYDSYADVCRDFGWSQSAFLTWRSRNKDKLSMLTPSMICYEYQKYLGENNFPAIVNGKKYNFYTEIANDMDWDIQRFTTWRCKNQDTISGLSVQDICNKYESYLKSLEGFLFEGKYYKSYKSVAINKGWSEIAFRTWREKRGFKEGKCSDNKSEICKLYQEYLKENQIIFKGNIFYSYRDAIRHYGWSEGNFRTWLRKHKNSLSSKEEVIKEYKKYVESENFSYHETFKINFNGKIYLGYPSICKEMGWSHSTFRKFRGKYVAKNKKATPEEIVNAFKQYFEGRCFHGKLYKFASEAVADNGWDLKDFKYFLARNDLHDESINVKLTLYEEELKRRNI